MSAEVLVEECSRGWRVVLSYPNGTRVNAGTYTAKYKAREAAERLAASQDVAS